MNERKELEIRAGMTVHHVQSLLRKLQVVGFGHHKRNKHIGHRIHQGRTICLPVFTISQVCYILKFTGFISNTASTLSTPISRSTFASA